MIQYPKNYVVWDLETSGLNALTDKILEIGYAIVREGAVVVQKSILLNHQIKIEQITTDLTGITQEMIDREGVDPKMAIGELRQVLQNTPHVTHNGLKFDIPFLMCSMSKDDVEFDYEEFKAMLYKFTIDTAVLYKAQKAGRIRRVHETFREFGDRVMEERIYGLKFNVKVCCEELGIPLTEQHRALADVLLTNQIYQKLCLPSS